MSKTHVVQAGECLSSIADAHGFFWQSLWAHPNNRGLRAERDDPNTLAPGDRVFIPDLSEKTVAVATDARHQFRKKGVPTMLRLRLLAAGAPRADVPYVLRCEGAERCGRTDADGRLEEPLPSQVTHVELVVGEGEAETVYHLEVGHLDPYDTSAGARARLGNLGFGGGASEEDLRAQVAAFQAREGLEVTGELDDVTCAALRRLDEG